MGIERRKRKLENVSLWLQKQKWDDLRSDYGNCETGSVELASSAERCRVGDLVTLVVTTKAFLGRS